MSAAVENVISKIRSLSPQQVAEVEDFVEFLATRTSRRSALDRLLAIAPALEAAGETPMTDEAIQAEVQAEIDAVRAQRRARAQAQARDAGADRS
jgi:hypothetical protein